MVGSSFWMQGRLFTGLKSSSERPERCCLRVRVMRTEVFCSGLDWCYLEAELRLAISDAIERAATRGSGAAMMGRPMTR
jgi:hypothetical protein